MNWLRNIASNYVRFIAGLAVMAVMTPVIIDAIGLNSYGQWAIIFAAIGLVSLSDLGFATAAIKFLAEAADDQKQLGEMTGSLLAVYSALTLLCGATVVLVYLVGWMPLNDAFLLLGFSTTVLMATSVHRAYLIAAGQQEVVNWIIVTGTLAQAALTWFLLARGDGVLGMAAAHCLSSLVQALLFVIVARWRFFPTPAFRHIRRHAMRIAQFSVWALLANICFMLILRVDPLLIEAILNPEAVALFAIALKVGEQVLLFNKQFSNALLPLISRYQSSEQAQSRRELLVYATRYLLVFAAPLTLLLAASSQDLLRIWIGAAVVGGADSLSVLAVAALASTIQFNAANVLGMSGQPRFVATSMLLSATLKIALGLLLLDSLGIVGAAIASLVAALVCEAGRNVWKACRLTGLNVSEFIVRGVVPGTVCALPALGMAMADAEAENLWQLLATCSVYGVISLSLFWFCCFNSEDRRFFNHFFKQEDQKEGTPCVQSTAN